MVPNARCRETTSLFAFETLCFFHTRLIEQSLLWVWQGLLLLHLSHNIMTRNASGAPRSACSEKTGTNGHISCWSQTYTTSSDPSHPQDRYFWTTSFHVTFFVDLFEINIFITWYSLFEHMFCLELGKVCKTNTSASNYALSAHSYVP